MADEDDTEKSEDPTQKRLDDAAERGDVAKSQEINTWFVIAGGTLVLSTFSGSIGGGILMPLRNLVANSWMIPADGAGLLALTQSLGIALLAALGVPFLMLALAAIAGNMIQHRLVWSSESLKPKFSKVSPGAGFKRVFGKQAAANFLKGLFKLTALGAVMTAILWPERHRLDAMVALGKEHDGRRGQCSRRQQQPDQPGNATSEQGIPAGDECERHAAEHDQAPWKLRDDYVDREQHDSRGERKRDERRGTLSGTDLR